MERLQGNLVKMALGVARNTPDYLWKLEAGRRSVVVRASRRTVGHVVQLLEMKEGRWPKVCLREDVRGILTGNPSR